MAFNMKKVAFRQRRRNQDLRLVGPEAQPDLNHPNARIDLVSHEGYVNLQVDGAPLRIPYPVPFRLPVLHDWVKGLD